MRARRADLDDVFEHNGGSVVMAGANVVRLSHLATHLLSRMTDWRTSDELATELVRQFGEPPHGTAVQLVETALTDLARLQIVQIET